MAKHANLKALFTAIANSIRNKTGGTDAIIADDFPDAIDGIQTGGGVDKIQRYIELQGNDADYLFYNFTGGSVDELLDGVDTSNVISARYMFAGAPFVESVPLFNTSKVTDMSYMFNGTRLETIPLFDTSNVKLMTSMFHDCKELTSIPLLNTSKVTDMKYMFNECSKLTSIPLLNTSKVTNMSYMFYKCSKLTSIPLFDTSNVTYTGDMLRSCSALEVVPALDMRNVTGASIMFSSSNALTEIWVRNIKTNLQVGSGTSWGHLLTLESLLHLCKECRKTTSSLKLTVGTANLEKLANVYVKLIDITDDMRAEDDLIDEKYPFVQCESTDEGAMTLQDYMATKMWSLA